MNSDTRKLLEAVQQGTMSVDEALLALKKEPFTDIGYAKVDMHRGIRQGAAEVIYGAGKTPAQMIGIVGVMRQHGLLSVHGLGSGTMLAACREGAEEAREDRAKLVAITVLTSMNQDALSEIGVESPVAEEAALTAEVHGNEVLRLYDVGVAGLHRTLHHMDDIMSASVIIAIAGMEGALASVIGGLADCPVIAVPTSVGYGAAFGGVAALLSMLNSCASGMSVVNIDNGFGAGYLASMINHMD